MQLDCMPGFLTKAYMSVYMCGDGRLTELLGLLENLRDQWLCCVAG